MKRTFQALTVAAALTVFGQVSWAQDFEKGLEAYNNGDYDAALEEWRPLAEQGYARTQYLLGWMYDNGLSVPSDYAEARKWYRLAAEQRDTTALNRLGVIYFYGRNVSQDYDYAFMWYSLAASLGDGWSIKDRDRAAALMTPEDISKAQALAAECVAKNYKGC
ncbi:hypothetical protein SuNHUV7_26090 (plasmid) [Pseudoseohaeicola sp. NH-UV-7]|uniref:tetratricopeptide repeat protein n=1 Tax=Sulfitobacter sp. TBRI5 TaxID=2989732 RepID=UPI003A786897